MNITLRSVTAKFLLIFVAFAYANSASATTAFVSGAVNRVLVADEGRWGECMVQLNTPLANAGLNCPGNWVTFSCSGVFTDKANAFRMYELAQMAYTLGKTVAVQVVDTKKHNGFCFGSRIDLIN